jgi:hypothetical protein
MAQLWLQIFYSPGQSLSNSGLASPLSPSGQWLAAMAFVNFAVRANTMSPLIQTLTVVGA